MRTWLAAGLLLFSVAVFLTRTFVPSLTAMTHSFPAYYTASRLVVERKWDARVYDDDGFGARVLETTDGRVSDHFSLHPPTTSLLLVPLTGLDLVQARIVWQWLNLALLAGALWLLLNTLGLRDRIWRALFLALALVFPPLSENFRVGQTYTLILFLFTCAFWSETRTYSHVTGIALGAAAGIKLSGAPIWLMLAVRGRWRALSWASVVVFLTAALSFLVLGGEGWLAFFRRVLDYAQPVPLAAHVAFQTTPSFFQRLFVRSPDFNPAPLLDAPLLASGLTAVVWLAAMILSLWAARRAPFDLAYGTAVTLGVILFPLAAEYHYTLLLIPLAISGVRVLTLRVPVDRIWFAAILLLLYMPFDWNSPYWSEPALSLFAYPRLYGGWLLWLWLLRQMSRPSVALIASPSGATH